MTLHHAPRSLVLPARDGLCCLPGGLPNNRYASTIRGGATSLQGAVEGFLSETGLPINGFFGNLAGYKGRKGPGRREPRHKGKLTLV